MTKTQVGEVSESSKRLGAELASSISTSAKSAQEALSEGNKAQRLAVETLGKRLGEELEELRVKSNRRDEEVQKKVRTLL